MRTLIELESGEIIKLRSSQRKDSGEDASYSIFVGETETGKTVKMVANCGHRGWEYDWRIGNRCFREASYDDYWHGQFLPKNTIREVAPVAPVEPSEIGI